MLLVKTAIARQLGIGVAVLAFAFLIWWFLTARGLGSYTLATGQDGGTYAVLGRVLEERVAGRIEIKARETEGSVENLRLLRDGEADFAIVQGGERPIEGLETVCPLYQDVLHVLVSEQSRVRTLRDLRGARISVGPEGSGMRKVALAVLAHFEVKDFEVIDGPEWTGIEVAGLHDGGVDAVFRVTALHSRVIEEAMGAGGLRLIGIGAAGEGLASRLPYLVPATIPAFAYPCASSEEGAAPRRAVQTVGLTSYLVCGSNVPAGAVYEMTKEVYGNRNQLMAVAPETAQIQEDFDRDRLMWPLSEGARKYLRRREPGFLERYAEVMAFLMSLGAATWAVWGAIAKWSSRKKKNRIDDYYLEVAAAFIRLEEDELSLESLAEERTRLRKLRGGAFHDLASEKLKADDSFEIFQNQVALCLDDVRRREERLR